VTTPSDLANSFEAMFALAGPTLEREFLAFSRDPVGRSLLAEQPRRDLNAVLSDRHGRATPSLACVDYEALLPQPLSEARRRIGVPSVSEVHPRGIPAKGWLLERVERIVAVV
jgi:hypothetical protein